MTSDPPATVQPPATRRKPLQWILVGVVLLIAFALCAYINGRWFSVHRVPKSGAQDLARHVALALNFRAATADGQFLPRIQPSTPEVPPMPVYQYYGTFEGLVAWPFLQFGWRGLRAVAAAIVLGRWVAFVLIYLTGRLLRAGPPAAALAGFAYLLSPYVINNELSRVAVAEVQAHNLLPLCTLGWALGRRGHHVAGAGVTALGMAMLALAHNVFFLYAAALLGILFLCTVAVDWRGALTLVCGGLGGVLLSAPQWFPTLLSQPDLVVNFTIRTMPFLSAKLVSLTGLFGWLQPLRVPEGENELVYYFTFAWWTLPAAGALLWASFRKSPGTQMSIAVTLLVAGVAFFLLSWPPVDFWAVLPVPFAAVQFSYRLISFVALLSGLGLAVGFPRLSWAALFALVPLMVFSQWPAIQTDTLSFGRLDLTDAQIASAYPLGDYISMSPPHTPPNDLCYPDGVVLERNRFHPRPAAPGQAAGQFLEVAGWNPTTLPLPLRLLPLDAQEHETTSPATPDATVPPGPFTVALPFDTRHATLRLRAEPAGVPPSAATGDDPHPVLIRVQSILQADTPTRRLLPSSCLEEAGRHGYEWTFRFLPESVADFEPVRSLRSSDGWMRMDNLITADAWSVRLQGSNLTSQTVHLHAARPEEPDVALGKDVDIPPGPYDIVVPLVGLPRPLRLVYSPFLVPHEADPRSTDMRRLGLAIAKDGVALAGSDPARAFVVQLPISYNRFWQVWQDGKPVPTFSDALCRLCIETERPTGALSVRYRLPWPSWVLLALGLAWCAFQPWLWRRPALAVAKPYSAS